MRVLLCWLLLLVGAGAESLWKIDLDGDGKLETVRLKPINASQGAWWVIVDGLWQSPDTLSDAGEGLAAVGDADGDGRVDLVMSQATRGGPPSNFALFPWTGSGFEWRVQEPKPYFESSRGLFEPDQPYRKGRYLEFQQVLKPGHVLALVQELSGSGVTMGAVGEAELKYTGQGYQVERWRMPFHRVASLSDLRLQEVLVGDCQDSDLTRLSARDLTLLRNSIYAVHGRPFQDPQLRAYFSKQSWYKVNPDYSEAFLSPRDKALALKIADYQRRSGKNW